MRKFDTYSTCSLRFKRWSRSAYASFCSIGKLVSIGQLSVDIAESAMLKIDGKLIEIQKFILNENNGDSDEEIRENELTLVLCPAQKAEVPAQIIFKFLIGVFTCIILCGVNTLFYTI